MIWAKNGKPPGLGRLFGALEFGEEGARLGGGGKFLGGFEGAFTVGAGGITGPLAGESTFETNEGIGGAGGGGVENEGGGGGGVGVGTDGGGGGAEGTSGEEDGSMLSVLSDALDAIEAVDDERRWFSLRGRLGGILGTFNVLVARDDWPGTGGGTPLGNGGGAPDGTGGTEVVGGRGGTAIEGGGGGGGVLTSGGAIDGD